MSARRWVLRDRLYKPGAWLARAAACSLRESRALLAGAAACGLGEERSRDSSGLTCGAPALLVCATQEQLRALQREYQGMLAAAQHAEQAQQELERERQGVSAQAGQAQASCPPPAVPACLRLQGRLERQWTPAAFVARTYRQIREEGQVIYSQPHSEFSNPACAAGVV